MYRRGEYDKMLSAEFRNKKFARGFLTDLMSGEEALSLEDALRHMIARMGTKEFSELANAPTQNVTEFVKKKRTLKPETLDKWLKPFGLRTKLVLDEAS